MTLVDWPAMPLPSTLRRGLDTALDIVLPPLCMACRTPVDAVGRLCAECWGAVDFIAAPYCETCGLPFPYDVGEEALCARCAASPPHFERARAAVRYGDVARRVVAGFKYGDRLHLVPALAAWLERAGGVLLADADLLVPVPLHRRRLFARRFNQAAMLALALSGRCGVPAAVSALVRHRSTPTQTGLDRAQRARNVRGAFLVPEKERTAVANGRIVLIDDVMTTGATADACARALSRAGARRIDVLTLARVAATE